jgi:hypothetical protein
MNQIVTILPLQQQILLGGNGHNYLFTFDEVSTYVMDTRGLSRADLEEYNGVELVEAYINDPYEVEALAEYSNK